jgi:hypothetical protein
VRRLVVFFVVAVLGAGFFGLSGLSSGIAVNGTTVSASTFRSELAAIGSNADLQCYLTALSSGTFSQGAGADSFAASGVAAWSSLRVEGMAIEQYVAQHLHYTPSAQDLAQAKASLEAELTTAASSKQYTCPGSSAQALASMPAEMRDQQILAQAASVRLLSTINSAIPVTYASLKAYYTAHRSDYDTLCVSAAIVNPANVAAFDADLAKGASVVALVKKYSLDRQSAAQGGAFGCYGPSSKGYATVRSDVGTTALNIFNATPQSVTLNNSTYALFVAVTKRSTTAFAQAEAIVYSDVQNLNASAASNVRTYILYRAAVSVDPAFGRWGLASSGPGVFAVAAPSVKDVSGATALATVNSSPYK